MSAPYLSGSGVCAWLKEMKAAGFGSSDAHCARLLGISANALGALKRKGCDKRTAWAFAALLTLEHPYSDR